MPYDTILSTLKSAGGLLAGSGGIHTVSAKLNPSILMNWILGFFNPLDFGTWLIVGILLLFIGCIRGIFAACDYDIGWGRWTVMVPVSTLFFCVTHPAKGLPRLILQRVGAAAFLKAGLSLMSVN